MHLHSFVLVAMTVALLANVIEGQKPILNVCAFCDKGCLSTIQSFKTKPYIPTLVKVINSKFAASGINIAVKFNYIQKTSKVISLIKYSQKKAGKDGLTLANKNFWGHSVNFQNMIDQRGCGIGFLLSSGRDKFWSKCPKDGIATMFGACQKKGTGTIKLDGDVKKMGTLMAHEIGHLLGASHDCAEVAGSWAKMKGAFPELAKIIDPVLKNCGPGKQCDGFVMNPSPTAFQPLPGKYSACSKAYINFFLQSKKYPKLAAFYNSKCIKKQ